MRVAPSFLGGRWLPSGALVDPVRLVHGLAAAASARGATIAAGARVHSLARAAAGVAVETTRGPVRAAAVVVAAGIRSAELLGAPNLLRPVRGQVLATAPLPPAFRLGLALDFGSVYWRQARDGAIVAGGLRSADPAAEATARPGVNPRIQAALERFLRDSFPELPLLAVARRWAGIMDETADGRPVAGRWSDRVWVAAGFGGHGLPPALGVGRALARSIVHEDEAAELVRLNPARLAAGASGVAA
jgi:glycine/D-amino acid oxidase-like deaminating enzyme